MESGVTEKQGAEGEKVKNNSKQDVMNFFQTLKKSEEKFLSLMK